ncbi:HD domain-containing protein [Pedobacter sp. BS3]|uniref:Pycsar system effector family protein n=1 Tax=Pedobacter sp. BS3 TaxID=2567937 RepID=UPI0011ECC05B|nr:Pycsar system effector family protein [Pedobacter sp. BS3]TZF81271.1 HD domain-containing protein [Pedobacter sp. BS3]
MKNNPILQDTSEFIFGLFKDKLPEKCVYHSFKHTEQTVKVCKELAEAYNLTSRDLEVLLLAAWFHDSGYIETYEGHEEKSVEIMKNRLTGHYKDDDIREIEQLILSTRFNVTPDGTLQEILHDADLINIGKKKMNEKAELLRIEWENCLNKKYTDLEWAELQLCFLLTVNFKTEEAQNKYGSQREANIRKQHDVIARLKADKEKALSKAEKSTEKQAKLGRGIETLYRSVYSYHINLSSIADNKAHIMININTIIISLIITLFGSGYTFASSEPEILSSVRFVFPMAALLLTSLLSVIFAILSARPTINAHEKYEVSNKKASVLFFGNFAQLQLDEFVRRIDELKEQQGELYNSMSVDLYHLGAVLVKKYRLLNWAYNIFMIGLSVCAVGFIVIVIFSM